MEPPKETSEEMQLQWEKLLERKQQLAEKIKSLNFFLANPCKNQELKELIEEKETLRKTEKETLEKIRLYERFIRDRLIVAEAVFLAITKKDELTDDIKNKIKKRFKTLVGKPELCRITKGKDSMDIINRFEEQVSQVSSAEPSWLVKWQLEAWNMEDEAKKDSLERSLPDVKNDIREADNRYREVRRSIESEVKKTKEELRSINEEVARWDEENGSRFALLSVSSSAPPCSKFPFKKRKRKKKSNLPVATSCDQNGHQNKKIWKFFVVFSENEQGEELSSGNKSEFSSRLKDILKEVKYRGAVRTQSVYNRLISITEMTPHQRRTMKEIFKGKRFLSWKIDNVSKKHRLYFAVDEEKNHIRFTIEPRKKAYGNH